MITQTSVRRFRKSCRLSQYELAELLGVGQSSVSRIESGGLPEPDVLIGLQVLFPEGLDALFPVHMQQIAEETITRAAELDRRLEGRHDRASVRKRAWLHDLMTRVTPQPA